MLPDKAGEAYKRIRVDADLEGAGMSSKFDDLPTSKGQRRKREKVAPKPKYVRKLNPDGSITGITPDGKEVNLTEEYIKDTREERIKKNFSSFVPPELGGTQPPVNPEQVDTPYENIQVPEKQPVEKRPVPKFEDMDLLNKAGSILFGNINRSIAPFLSEQEVLESGYRTYNSLAETMGHSLEQVLSGLSEISKLTSQDKSVQISTLSEYFSGDKALTTPLKNTLEGGFGLVSSPFTLADEMVRNTYGDDAADFISLPFVAPVELINKAFNKLPDDIKNNQYAIDVKDLTNLGIQAYIGVKMMPSQLKTVKRHIEELPVGKKDIVKEVLDGLDKKVSDEIIPPERQLYPKRNTDFEVSPSGETKKITRKEPEPTILKSKRRDFEKGNIIEPVEKLSDIPEKVEAPKKEVKKSETPSEISDIIERYEKAGEVEVANELRGIPESELTVKRVENIREVADEILEKVSEKTAETKPEVVPPKESNSFKRGDVVEQGIVPATVVEKTKKFAQRELTSRGDLPEVAFAEKTEMEGRKRKTEKEVSYAVKDLRKTFKKEYGRKGKTPQNIELMNDVLKGEADPSVLKPKTAEKVLELRNQVDKTTRELISEGAVEGDIAATMMDNIGVYLHRSYRVHDKGVKWDRTNIPKEVINKAENYISQRFRALGLELTKPELDGAIDAIIEKSGFGNFIRTGTLGRKDLNILKRRKNIPKEIRDLMGEYNDPLVNYTKSILRMSNILEGHKFLTEVYKKGKGEFFFDQPISNEKGKFVTQIVAEGNKALQPLDGLYTTKEIADAFTGEFNKSLPSNFTKVYMTINGAMKYSNVPLSPITSSRNIVSGFIMSLAQGHFNMSKLIPSFKGVLSDIRGKGKMLELYKDAAEHNVVGESVMRGELMDVLKDADLYKNDVAKFTSSTLDKGKKALKFPGEIYGAVDDFFKLYNWLNEVETYKKIYKEELASGEMTLAQIKKDAAIRVRDTYPTYSLVPEAIKKLRRFPLVGPFISFPAESVRTTYKTFKLIKEELADPKRRSRGIKRLVSFSSALASTYLIEEYTKSKLGISDDEDNDFKKFLPFWSDNNQLAYLGKDGKGVYEYVDVSFTDPYNYYKKIFEAFASGGDIKEAAIRSFVEALEPFSNEELLTGKLLDISRNQTKDGKQVWNPEDSLDDITKSITLHVLDGLKPGALRQIENIIKAHRKEVTPYGKEYRLQDEYLATFGGQRIVKSDVGANMIFKALGYQKRLDLINGEYIRSLYKYSGEGSEELLKEAQEKANRQKENAFKEFRDLIDSAERLGVSKDVILNALANTRLSKKERNSILSGQFLPLKDKSELITVNKILEKQGVTEYRMEDTKKYGVEEEINPSRFKSIMQNRKDEAKEMLKKGEITQEHYNNKIKVIDEAIEKVESLNEQKSK